MLKPRDDTVQPPPWGATHPQFHSLQHEPPYSATHPSFGHHAAKPTGLAPGIIALIVISILLVLALVGWVVSDIASPPSRTRLTHV